MGADKLGGILIETVRSGGRSVAVMFMVDMSGSTKGWINDAERESLILLCEALESVREALAITAFPVLARILRERNLLATNLGATALRLSAAGRRLQAIPAPN